MKQLPYQFFSNPSSQEMYLMVGCGAFPKINLAVSKHLIPFFAWEIGVERVFDHVISLIVVNGAPC